MVNEYTREIQLACWIIHAIPDLWPRRTQFQNNDCRQSYTGLRIWLRALTLIIYRLEPQPLLLKAILKSAYCQALRLSAILASVFQGEVKSTKAFLSQPCTDWSWMTRSGLCACAKTSVRIDPPLGACSPLKSQYSSTVLGPQG
jgi:hypothetical protein